METNKIVFLCLILLLVLVVSNYVSIEGFAAKKSTATAAPKPAATATTAAPKPAAPKPAAPKPAATSAPLKSASSSGKKENGNAKQAAEKAKQAAQKAKQAEKKASAAEKKASTAEKQAKKATSDSKKSITESKKAISESKKAIEEAKKQSKSATDKINELKKQVESKKGKKGKKGPGIQNTLKQMESLVKNTKTLVKNAESKIKQNEAKIKKNEESNQKIFEKASSLDANTKQVANAAAKIDSTLSDVKNIANATQKGATSILTQVSEKSASVNKSVDDNKTIQKEINAKVDGVDAKMETIKNNVDTVIQIKKEVDNTMNEFKVNSETMMKTIQLAIDKFDAAKLSASKQGFQNMDPVVNATHALKKDMEMAKSLSFTTIDSAYDGNLKLEGFGDSTETDSAYQTSPDSIFVLEKDVITALNDFYTAYYAYQTCLHNGRKDLDNKVPRRSCGTAPSTNPTVAGTGELGAVYAAKEALIQKINKLNTAIDGMKNKPTAPPNADGSYVIAGKKVTEDQFRQRHTAIKSLSESINNTRSDLDMKMATLLDKSKGPLPEAQNKHNFENYATIGWSVLATSILYYTFVEMK
jgi:myosin heavy subunit